jgi:hypothetical protein
MNKKEFGQFFTTNYKYILNNIKIIPSDLSDSKLKFIKSKNIKSDKSERIIIIEPFCGNGDLLQHLEEYKNTKFIIQKYDIEPTSPDIKQQDTILNPPDYKNSWVITNPPYLSRNKNVNKSYYDKYNTNDLYKCFIKELLTNKAQGGILIIPLNFFCSIRKNDIELRSDFLNIYNITHLNIFEHQVFNDTSYTVCSFGFKLNTSQSNLYHILKCDIYSQQDTYSSFIFKLNEDNNYTFGGEIYNLQQSKFKISRLFDIADKTTNILLKCIDDKELINLKYVVDSKLFIDKSVNKSARSYATLDINPLITPEIQMKLVDDFNKFLSEYRIHYLCQIIGRIIENEYRLI